MHTNIIEQYTLTPRHRNRSRPCRFVPSMRYRRISSSCKNRLKIESLGFTAATAVTGTFSTWTLNYSIRIYHNKIIPKRQKQRPTQTTSRLATEKKLNFEVLEIYTRRCSQSTQTPRTPSTSDNLKIFQLIL